MFSTILICSLSVGLSLSLGVQSVEPSADGKTLNIRLGSSAESFAVVELQSWQPDAATPQAAPILGKGNRLELPRFDGSRDRLYSRFGLVQNGRLIGPAKYPANLAALSADRKPFLPARGKKGLQVQMIDDALALGIQQATINLRLESLLDPSDSPGSFSHRLDGAGYHFRKAAVEDLDRQIKAYAEADAQVTLILLAGPSAVPAIDRILRHPRTPDTLPSKMYALNVATEEGYRWFRASVEFLAHRYCGPKREAKRPIHFIVGNEVNSHFSWFPLGKQTTREVAAEYLRVLRVAHAAVRSASASSRIYASFDHYWAARFNSDALLSCGSRPLLDAMTRLSRAGGDFDWHIAFHPYPENLFEPRSWLDKSPTHEFDTPKVTFKNLEVLTRYLDLPIQRCFGSARRVILSEQGFNTPKGADGETKQAAGFCYGWKKANALPGIDAFILHRHVDHTHEGGLRLGLWTNKPDSVNTPDGRKLLYEVFHHADADDWQKHFQFALPLIGAKDWNSLP